MKQQNKELLAGLLSKKTKSDSLKSEPVKASVKTEYIDKDRNSHTVNEDIFEVDRRNIRERFGSLSVNFSHTRPMGDFESVKISIGISIPIGLETPEWYPEEIKSKYNVATRHIEEQMEKELKSVDDFIKNRNG